MNSKNMSHGHLMDVRIRILDVMGANLAEQPQVVEWAKRLAASGNEVIEKKESYKMLGGMGMSGPDPRGVNLGRSPLDAWTALMISKTLSGFPGVSVAAGLLEPPLDASKATQERATEALARLAKEYPQETAKAVIAHLERLEEVQPGMGGHLVRGTDDGRPAIAKSLLTEANVDSIAVVRLQGKALKESDPASIFNKADSEDLLRQYAVRLSMESYDKVIRSVI